MNLSRWSSISLISMMNLIVAVYGDYLVHKTTWHTSKLSLVNTIPLLELFEGGHTIEPQNVRSVLVPMIQEMLATVHPLHERYFRHFKGNLYQMWHIALDSETMERKVVYQALYGEHGYWFRPKQIFFEVIERDDGFRPVSFYIETIEE